MAVQEKKVRTSLMPARRFALKSASELCCGAETMLFALRAPAAPPAPGE